MGLVVLLTVGGAIPVRRERHTWKRLTVKYYMEREPCAGLNSSKQPIITADMCSLLADVLPGQHFVAGLTLKAAQMPLFVQSKESLSVLNVSATSCAIYESKIGVV